jgi:epoxyqueuosine reductase
MSNIISEAGKELKKLGLKAKTVSTVHLPQLQEDIDRFHRQDLLDKQLSERYLRFEYNISAALPDAQSLFSIAVPQPITRARFTWQGIAIETDIPPTYIGKKDDTRVKDTLTSVLAPAGYRLERARLSVKTLAVRSGLAQYGRNNITYVPGMGSFQRLVAFYSDCPIERDDWQELRVMKACDNCFKCLENCPTQCISTGRFLIHAENCLTYLNESEREFPDWVKPDWHNALIGCMRCQLICPVNKTQIKKVVDGPKFSEKETGLLLQKTPFDKLAEETREKLANISADGWYEVLARNLNALIESRRFIPRVP